MKRRQSNAAASTAATLMLALCCAWPPGPAGAAQTQAQAQAQPSTSEQSAATQRQTRKTDQANRAAAVEDETSAAAQAARTAQSETAQFEAQARRSGSSGTSGGTSGRTAAGAPSYGPTLTPRGQQPQDSARKDPAEVHDETDSLARPAPAQPADPAASQRRNPNPNLRRPAWQPATAPMAPRPLRSASADANPADAALAVPLPPAPAVQPRGSAPTRSVIVGCQGNSCTDTSGQRYNGIGTGHAGVNGSGRLCTRSGVTVQCF
jgi:hypothetical protein